MAKAENTDQGEKYDSSYLEQILRAMSDIQQNFHQAYCQIEPNHPIEEIQDLSMMIKQGSAQCSYDLFNIINKIIEQKIPSKQITETIIAIFSGFATDGY